MGELPTVSIEPENDLPMTPERRTFLSKLVKADLSPVNFIPATPSEEDR